KVNDKMTVTKIHLSTIAKVPGIDAKTFEAKATDAKNGCPISRLLSPGAAISPEAKLA
ncbi:partial Peroxiredoxin OsmC, partial [Planctomycetaceae bacterium]